MSDKHEGRVLGEDELEGIVRRLSYVSANMTEDQVPAYVSQLEELMVSLIATVRHLQERLEGQRGLVEAADKFREAEAAYKEGEQRSEGYHERYFVLVRASDALLAAARKPQPPPDERGAVEGQEVGE